MDSVVDLLDRQADFIVGQEPAEDLLAQIEPFLDALRSEPRLAVHLQDLENELVQDVHLFAAEDEALVAALIELRAERVELEPDADDSDAELPRTDDPSLAAEYTLAYFDHIAEHAEAQINVEGGGRAETLLGILQSKAMQIDRDQRQAGAPPTGAADMTESPPAGQEPAEPEVDDLRRWRWKVGNIDGRLNYAKRRLALRMQTSPGLSYARLSGVPELLNPQPQPITSPADLLERMNQILKQTFSVGSSLSKFGRGESLTATDKEIVHEQVERLRRDIRRLHQELRHRVGTTRSRLALIHRFKLRCEWHDRDRLAALADDHAMPGGPEDRLTGELARYLFDQGFLPLTKPMTGGLQPDLLDPQQPGVYVEAKQYKSSARREVVKSVAQVLDTVGRLQGGPYAVNEAFVVVFRRSGPRYILPETLEAEGYRVHLVLIDLAASDESGSRQEEKPVVLTSEEFFAADQGASGRSAGKRSSTR